MAYEFDAAKAANEAPDTFPMQAIAAYSSAISAKRQADALERISESLIRLARAEYLGAILTQNRGR